MADDPRSQHEHWRDHEGDLDRGADAHTKYDVHLVLAGEHHRGKQIGRRANQRKHQKTGESASSFEVASSEPETISASIVITIVPATMTSKAAPTLHVASLAGPPPANTARCVMRVKTRCAA